MKIGITLPQFRHEAEPALDSARQAEAAGFDGVFVFDHLWPIAHSERPALHGLSLLGALAVETDRVMVGTLVARVGLLPDAVLVHTLATLARMAGDRLIAGLGVGDALSRDENRAYGVPFAPPAERRESLAGCCRRLRHLGIETWVGGLSTGTRRVGRAEADALNLWGTGPDAVAAEAASTEPIAVTWGGQLDVRPGGPAAGVLRSLASAGATWAVVAPVGVPWTAAVEATARAAKGLS
jgi:alkanesulfonate monooxygenase SsuD/methylene tetrahydromethanopterin reductase-like flavin-dependent oxidoreductase (luciferase family)